MFGSCEVCSCDCLLLSAPAKPANLQLSFSVAAVNQVSVSAATYRFLLPPLPTGFCFRCYLQVCAGNCARRHARIAAFSFDFQPGPVFLITFKLDSRFLIEFPSQPRFFIEFHKSNESFFIQ
ncbi:hypothetical protein [Methanimicrococcus hongohii]|uniref:hypothetical protein n=1 Tax=Methanimicrococcus hongohii TaxID=3028295 RepID=UPI002931D4D9|nr:hypothetical protein [Methanimicrococcus sp. Hf6]